MPNRDESAATGIRAVNPASARAFYMVKLLEPRKSETDLLLLFGTLGDDDVVLPADHVPLLVAEDDGDAVIGRDVTESDRLVELGPVQLDALAMAKEGRRLRRE